MAGTSLKVPDTGVAKNDSNTFKPYNPNEIVGSTAPSLPYIPPGSSSACGYIVTLIVIIAVMVFVPQLAPLIGPLATGATATAGAVAGATLAGTAIATGIVTFVAHAAATAVGSAMGLTSFSWRASAGQGIAAGLTAGIAGKLGTTGELLKSFSKAPTLAGAAKIAASAASGTATSYAGNKIAGVQGTSFSWKAIAASAVANIVSASISNGLDLTPKYENGVITTGEFGKDFLNNAIGGVAELHTRRAFGFNDKVDYGAIAASAFTSALGNAVGKNIAQTLADNQALKNMNSEQRQLYDVTREQGLSKRQSLDYAMDVGGLRTMGNNWFGLGENKETAISAYSEPGAARSQRVLSGTGENLTSDQIKMMHAEYATVIVPKLEKIKVEYNQYPERGSELVNEFAFKFAEIAAPFTKKYGYEIGAYIVAKDKNIYLSEITLGSFNEKNGLAGVAIPMPSNLADFILADVHTHPYLSGDGFSGRVTTYLGGGYVGEDDFYASYSRGIDGYVFKIDKNNDLAGWRFDYSQFKHDADYYKNISPIDSRNVSKFTNQYYWNKVSRP